MTVEKSVSPAGHPPIVLPLSVAASIPEQLKMSATS